MSILVKALRLALRASGKSYEAISQGLRVAM
jgi:hypothetical protein